VAAKKKASSTKKKQGPKDYVVTVDDGLSGDKGLVGPFTKAAAEKYVEKQGLEDGNSREAVKLTKP
jgi:hypothetical protein